MNNKTFAIHSPDSRQRKLESYLRQMSDNRLDVGQLLELVACISFDLQYFVFVHERADTFLTAIAALDLKCSTVVFGELMPGNSYHPPYLLDPSAEAAVVTNEPETPAIYLYLPAKALERK